MNEFRMVSEEILYMSEGKFLLENVLQTSSGLNTWCGHQIFIYIFNFMSNSFKIDLVRVTE
jgi:hypothetical protein